jgi:4a-hydroxytetrahydrobiopterin dehydratase
MPGLELAQRHCTDCAPGTPPLDPARCATLLADLDGWSLERDGRALCRRFDFKGFAKAVEMANLAAWLGNRQGHHPDIAFGWGYCTVTFTTHAAGGLTENDFICAARLDALLA